MYCSECFSEQVVKNGKLGNGKPKYKCKRCSRQFVKNPRKQRISEGTKTLIDKLLLEKIPLVGIGRVPGISKPWIPGHVNQKYNAMPQQVEVKKRERASYDPV